MTVFVAHAPADQKVAADVEKFLERRGQFTELDDGMAALPPVTRHDVLVLLLSKDFVFAPTRLRLEQRALDAWAEGRLIVVRLDKGIAPVGLRDLPALDASFEAQREFKWNELSNQIREKRAWHPDQDEAGGGELGALPAPQAPVAAKKNRGALGLIVPILLLLPGVAALALTVSIWLVNRIGPKPGSLDDLLNGINAFGARMGLPSGVMAPVCGAAILLMLMSFALIVARIVTPIARSAKRSPAPPPPAAETTPAPPQVDAVFVSYARANEKTVLPVIEAAKRDGKTFWLDQQSIPTAEGWAGEIVKGIRSAREVLVMCSKAAFESDHVKREIYLADRYQKRLVPVFIEDATPPEDFEYFFAGVQTLKLFETPETERAAALVRALA
ncbi:MAG: toll/interleukin-1 receptor domain-containing protein [Terricaulis sp.]